MSCITKLLELKGDKELLLIKDGVGIEGGGVYKDYEYLITFIESGHRCGYVALKPEHLEQMGNEPDDYDFPCHGGVTFHGSDHAAKKLLPIHCDDVWLGFDAAHHRDAPCKETAMKYFGKFPSSDHYMDAIKQSGDMTHKTYGYMENECKRLIDHIIGLSSAP